MKAKKTEELYRILVGANEKYRAGYPVMSDYEFDKLESELRELDPENEWFDKGVNDPSPKEREFKLPYPMMSLNKVKRIEDVQSWMDKFPGCSFVITPKFDGLSVGISRDKAWTRGDGMVGQICTDHLSLTDKKPSIDSDEVIRGEIIIENSNWPSFKEMHKEAKSPRNSATGLINGDFDAERADDYKLLTVMPYGSQNVCGDKADELERIGAGYHYAVVSRDEIDADYMNTLFFRWSKLYPMDGLVIDVNEAEWRHGTEANGNPSYSIAYKHHTFSEVGETVVEKVELNINRDGVLTPVVHIEPELALAGATISKVNGINMRYINDWKIFPGEKLRIVRSGEVIPKIVSVGSQDIPFRDNCPSQEEYLDRYWMGVSARMDEYSGPWTIDELEYCPFCGNKLEKDGNSDSYVNYVCKNEDCPEKKIQSIVKFFEICGLEGFKEAKIRQLADIGKIDSNFLGAFSLGKEDLSGIEGWGDKSVDDFIKKLDVLRKGSIPFARFLHATGYFGDLGEKTLQNIIDNVNDVERPSLDELMSIEGVQEATARKYLSGIGRYLRNKENIDNVFSFSYIKTKANDNGGPLSGRIICATGFRDKVLFKKIEDMGGTVSDSLSKAVNMLIVKDLSSTSSKVQKARKNGIEIISRDEFIERYGK